MGRSIFATEAAAELELEASVVVTHIPVSTSPPDGLDVAQTRETMARVFEAWSDYSGFIAEHSGVGDRQGGGITEEEAREHFRQIAEACRSPSGYVLWLCTVCTVTLGKTAV